MRTITKSAILFFLLIIMVASLSGCSNLKQSLESGNGDRITVTQYKQTEDHDDATQTSTEAAASATEAPTQHVHNFTDATCLEPKKCTDCGATQGDPLGHDYSVVEEDGTKSCSRCGQIDPESRPIGLEEIFLVDSYNYHYSADMFTDSYGYTYNGAHFFGSTNYSNGKAEAYFNIDNCFTEFRASIVAGTETRSNTEFYIKVYIDNELVYTSSTITRISEKIDFCIPVTNGQLLKIESSSDQYVDSSKYICIVDAYLVK